MDKVEEKALKDIEECGCHVLHVMQEGEYPRFSYSIGIQRSTGQPELIVTGLKQELAHWIINEYSNRIKAGEIFSPGNFYDGFVGGFDVTFKEVEEKHYQEYFGWAQWLYKGNNFNALQLIYPSKSGVWPWERGAPADFTWFIPRLYAS
ncbi:DUF4262 domain-containing protein [Gilvimarinus sp. DA14]|uniref:DUF4262 domain-containing protein n=1 Tax=Gilvimarinus sp. DA14 TaxID=2956798 RepID=UPI0020B843FA|nr:DUF4262 domain-containing protein [Gilvimarinus sp. DA14]UTF60905.1 DUF4262 domain-containing protein [Gilvimarinus sp. DA14]